MESFSENTSSLMGIRDLFRATFSLYRERFSVFVGIFLLVHAASTLLFAGGEAAGESLGGWVFILAFILSLFASLWGMLALIRAIAERSCRMEGAFSKAFPQILLAVPVVIFMGVLQIGGYFFFIVPGIIFFVWFFFALYALALDEFRGMSALFQSRQLVRGRWTAVFVRILALNAVGFLFIVAAVGGAFLISSLVGGVAGEALYAILSFAAAVLWAPVPVIFGFTLYEDLKKASRHVPFQDPSRREKIVTVSVAALGWVILVSFLALSLLGQE